MAPTMTTPTHPMTARRRLTWLAVPMLALAGCASAPPAPGPVLSVETPTAWTALDGAVPVPPDGPSAWDVARWWEGLGDAALTAWVQAALQTNTDLRAAQAALAQARAVREAAQAATWPSVDASVGARQARTQAGGAHAVSAGLDAQWELDLWGRRNAAVQASEADERATAASLAWTRVSLAAEVAAAYWDLWSAQQRLQTAQQSLAAQTDSVQLTQWRVQAGLSAQQDLDSARANLEQTRASVAALHASARQALHALNLLAGRPAGAAPLAQPAERAPEPPPAWTLPVPADTLRQRPDVAAAWARWQAAAARVAQADAARLPTLTLTGSLSWQAPRVSELLDPAALTRALVASVAAPLFDAGQRQAQVRQQQAALEQARAALEGALLAALRDVENALVAIASDRARVQHLLAAEEAAAAALQQATLRHRAGLTDLRTLLDAQRSWLAVRSERIAAQAQWATDHARLFKALGGGWQPADTDPVPERSR